MSGRPTVGGLFAGYGGLELALRDVFDAEPAWFSEYDAAPSAILTHHFPGVPNLGDVTRIDWGAVTPVNILTAGYPCQPFSLAGHREGTDDERHLWPHVADAIRHLRPELVVLENVAGHRSLGLDAVLGDLAGIGYDAEWTSLRASEAAAPHHRERLFITAHPQGQRGDALGRAHVSPVPVAPPAEWTVEPVRSLGGALRAWGEQLGRPAPVPAERRQDDRWEINPRFHEWVMGLPDGWVTDVPGLTLPEQLKALGNGVVPQQAAAAIRHLLDIRANAIRSAAA